MFRKFLIVLCGIVAGLASAEQRWNNRVWNIDHGLVDNWVVGVKQSSDGFLWVATVRGVMRFDGREFKALPISTEFASAGRIHSFFIDSLDRFWITQMSGEVICLDRGNVVMKIPAPAEEQNPGLPTIVEEQPRRILLCFPNGDFVRVDNGTVAPVAEEDQAVGPKFSVVKDGFGQIYYSQGAQGIGVVKDGILSYQAAIRADLLGAAQSGGVWVCSGKELWKFEDSGSLERICELPEEMDVERVPLRVMFEDRQGGLWLASEDKGLFYFEGHSFQRAPCPSKNIASVDEDRDGNIWVGTGDGLNLLTPAVVKFLRGNRGDFSNHALSVAQDTNGLFWVVWSSGFISRSLSSDSWGSLSDGEWTVLDAKYIHQPQCVIADPSGGVWFGTDSSGIYYWKDGGVGAHFGRENGLAANSVNVLHMTQDGTLWIGSEKSDPDQFFLQSLQDGRLQSCPLPSGTMAVVAFASDTDGNCWFATYDGRLFYVNRNGGFEEKTSLLSPAPYTILSLWITVDKSLWIGFAGQGLGRLKNGRFSRYRTEQGLHENFISRIISDQSGRLWFAGNRGIARLSPEDFDALDAGRSRRVQPVVYGKQQGLSSSKSTEFFGPGAIRDNAGRLLFGMKGGLAVIRPEEAGDRQAPPPVVIVAMNVDGRTIAEYGVEAAFSGSGDSKPFELRAKGNQRLRIPPGVRHLEIVYTALGFKLPESTVFKCRLQGFEHDWNDVGNQRAVSYYGIRPGDYQFQVIARNSDGVWNEKGALLTFTLEQYWWEAAWFRLGGPLVAFCVFVFGLVFFMKHRQKLQVERLELLRATDKERARIAADLHDEVGSGLTEVRMTGDFVLRTATLEEETRQYVAEMVDKAHEMTESLSEIVWAANPIHDTVASLVGYSVRYLQRIMGKMPVKLILAIEKELPGSPMRARVRHQLFLAFREAVTNIVRHAGATEVKLTVAWKDNVLSIMLQDNGHGMDLSVKKPDGNGLLNMRNRLETIDGICLIDSEIGRGTRIIFEIKL